MAEKPTYQELEDKIQVLEQSEKKLRESEEWFRLAFHTSPDSINLNRASDGVYIEKAEDDLRESEEKYRQIYENILDVYYETSLEGIILEVSPSIEKFSKYKRKELIGKSVYEIYPNPGDRDRLFERIMAQDLVRDHETTFKDKDNTLYTCSMNIELIRDARGNPLKIVGIVRDISDRKKTEQEKIKAQKIAADHEKLALVGQVAGKMAHDFNNVLGIIMGNAQLSLLNCQEGKIKKTLELIYEQTLRGKNLTRNLVAFARDQEPKQEFFKINEKFDLVINLLRKDLEGVELIKEDKPGIPDLLADPGMIEHALVNLIQNSIHATSMVKNPKIIIRTYAQENFICFEIEDNGCGISREHLESIYEPSFTLKGSKDLTDAYESSIKGTGYGMSNVKKYVVQHKGTIQVESTINSGTKFTVCLPIIQKQMTPQEKKEIRNEIAHVEKYILLVEDEPDISQIQYNLLTQEPCKHQVDIAGNGQMAMDLLDRNSYDFVSLDYMLPGKSSGMDVYHYIRKTNHTIPILFISGNLEFLESIKTLKQQDDFIDHLSKPCGNTDYVKRIHQLLEKSPGTQ